MIYYQVKKENDNKRHNCRTTDFYIGGELYTEREMEKLSLNKEYCDKIEISKRDTFFCFGARFAKERK